MLDRWKITAALVLLVQPCIASDSQSFQISVIPSFFRGPKCNWRSALRCGGSRLTSPEARVRGSELSRKRLRHAQCGTLGPPFALYEGQKASKRGRSRNEGIPEGSETQLRPPIHCLTTALRLRGETDRAGEHGGSRPLMADIGQQDVVHQAIRDQSTSHARP